MDLLRKLSTSLLLFFFSSLLLGQINRVDSSNQHHHHHHHHHHRRHHHHHFHGPKKLFVFGDSYVDTGNINEHLAVCWRYPYGITYPRKPSGRFSDGLVSTDFLAKLLRVESPITYHSKDYMGKERLQHGMNFAYGGTGVFNTQFPLPNMTNQINLFEQLLGDVYSPSDLSTSLAFLSVAGNDYANYRASNGSFYIIPAFIKKVVRQTKKNLRRIHGLGVKKIAVASLQPLGCLPVFTQEFSHERCNDNVNVLVRYHNRLLKKVVARLNKKTNHSTFAIIDFYKGFSTVIKKKRKNGGRMRFKTMLKPCCEGDCGNVDENSVKRYTLCDDPKSAFFWDGLHPTHEGWKSVYSVLRKNLIKSLT